MHRNGMTGSYSKCMLTSRETSKLFSMVVEPFYIPTDSVWKLQVLHILSNTWYDHSFNFRYSESVHWNLMVSIFISFMINDVENLFIYLPWWSVCSNISPIFSGYCLFFIINFVSSLHILDINPLIFDMEIFSPKSVVVFSLS